MGSKSKVYLYFQNFCLSKQYSLAQNWILSAIIQLDFGVKSKVTKVEIKGANPIE